jgi:ribosomal protein S27E
MATVQLNRAHVIPLRAEPESFEEIRCPECGRTDPAPEGAALIFSLEAPCPDCGGRHCEFVPARRPIRRVA